MDLTNTEDPNLILYTPSRSHSIKKGLYSPINISSKLSQVALTNRSANLASDMLQVFRKMTTTSIYPIFPLSFVKLNETRQQSSFSHPAVPPILAYLAFSSAEQ